MTLRNGAPRALRLLPSVVAVGAVLLVLKTSGLVHDAYAQGAEKSGEKVAALSNDPVPANPDYAGGADDEIASASQVDVLNALGKRRRELDARAGTLTIQANMIAAAESRVDAKIAQLKTLQAQITALLTTRDEAQKAQITALVKTYSLMKSADAARIFNTLPDDVLVPVAQNLKADILSGILAKMNPDTAQKLTVKLANKLALPQTADALAPSLGSISVPPPALAAASPAPVQAAEKPATKTAAAAPAPAPTAAAAPAAKPGEKPGEKPAPPKT